MLGRGGAFSDDWGTLPSKGVLLVEEEVLVVDGDLLEE